MAGADPVPWVAWEEQDGNVNGSGNHDQIFVSKGVKQAAPNAPCAGFKPSANASVSNFCWQQVGLDRLAKDGGSSPTGDPTLNIDPSRNGVEPDIAFTGPSDTVGVDRLVREGPEQHRPAQQRAGLRGQDRPGRRTPTAASTGRPWATAPPARSTSSTRPAQRLRHCAESTDAEDACSLNKLAGNDAEDPRVAAGTLTPGGADRPVGRPGRRTSAATTRSSCRAWSTATTSSCSTAATRSRARTRTPARRTSRSSATRRTSRGRSGSATRQARLRRALRRLRAVRLDTPGGIRLTNAKGFAGGPASLIDARVALSSSCTADPFTADGTTCAPAAVNAAFDTFTTAGTPQRLFSQALTGGPNCVLFYKCELDIHVHAPPGEASSRSCASATSWGSSSTRSASTAASSASAACRWGPTPAARCAWLGPAVNGKPLKAGRYRVTLRALDKKGNVLGLTKPFDLRVK